VTIILTKGSTSKDFFGEIIFFSSNEPTVMHKTTNKKIQLHIGETVM
jgi:hypothetical protein